MERVGTSESVTVELTRTELGQIAAALYFYRAIARSPLFAPEAESSLAALDEKLRGIRVEAGLIVRLRDDGRIASPGDGQGDAERP